jgi:pyruvate dehydrogenase E2 component (dihydrolipoamide acetyltransferase)
MGDFRMPSLGADMEVGTVLEWRVQPGDTVHRGDIVAVVDTEKATIEVEIFEDGVVDELLVAPGTEVPVGTPLATITPFDRSATSGDAASVPKAPKKQPTTKPAKHAVAGRRPMRRKTAPTSKGAEPPRPSSTVEVAAPMGVRSSPLARHVAAERGVDLATITGTGPQGAVLLVDVERAATAPTPPADLEQVPIQHPAGHPHAPPSDRQAAMRHAIGALMARSKREIPHYYLARSIDLGRAMTWLDEENQRGTISDRLLPASLLLKATARAAREVPSLNGLWDDGFTPSGRVHLGVGISLRGGGIIAPAIHDADQLALVPLMATLRDLVQRARAGCLRSSEMADPTITVTNLGDQGADEVFGVIYPPQVAVVGFGRITERPWAVEGMVGVRPVVRATLAADHRASDGHDGARFLAALDHLLQRPEDL